MGVDWEIASVAQLEAAGVLLVQDGNHGAYRPRPHEIVESGIPHIRAADVSDDGSIDFVGAQQLASSAWERIRKGRARGGDVLLTHKGTVGRVAAAPSGSPRFLCSPQTTLWRSLDPLRLDQGYVAAFLRSGALQAQLRSVMHESDMAPYVSLTSQRGLRITLPPIAEQRAIASVLGALDGKIESNRRFACLLRDLVGLSYHGMVSEARDDLGIYEVASVGYGAPFASGSFVKPGTGVPLLRIRDLKSRKPGVWTTETRPGARLVRRGDVVVGMDAEFRACCWAGEDAWLNQRVCVFDPLPGVSRAYVLEGIKRPLALQEATKSGTTVIHLGKSDINTFRLPKLPADEMARMRERLDQQLDLAVSLERESDHISAIRDALLPKLVSGQIRVPLSDPDESLSLELEARVGHEVRP